MISDVATRLADLDLLVPFTTIFAALWPVRALVAFSQKIVSSV
jgi:hypothetical protein